MIIVAVLTTSCSEFALLASGASIAGTQNAYVKAYNGADILTIMYTDKGIKTTSQIIDVYNKDVKKIINFHS